MVCWWAPGLRWLYFRGVNAGVGGGVGVGGGGGWAFGGGDKERVGSAGAVSFYCSLSEFEAVAAVLVSHCSIKYYCSLDKVLLLAP